MTIQKNRWFLTQSGEYVNLDCAYKVRISSSRTGDEELTWDIEVSFLNGEKEVVWSCEDYDKALEKCILLTVMSQ